MLVKFLEHTGGDNGDPDAKRALDYLLGEIVLKREADDGSLIRTRRARPPIPLSGDAELVRRTCASLTFKHRYASAVLAFERSDIDVTAFEIGEPALRALCEEVMRDFEATAFAGIPEAEWPHVLWIAHTDKDRLELNALFPRAVSDANGRVKAINPKPPGRASDALWDAFRDTWNHREGWADPEDPERHRSVRIPGATLKRPPPREADGSPGIYPQMEIADRIGHEIQSGNITGRDGVILWLETHNYAINRKGKDYLSVKPPLSRTSQVRNDPKTHGKPMRLKGDIFDSRFTSHAWLADQGWFHGEDHAPIRDPAPARDLSGARDRLEHLRGLRAAHHAERLGWPQEQEPLPSPLTVGEDLRTQDDAAPGYGESVDIPNPTAEPAAAEGPPPKPKPSDYKSRLWSDLYGSGSLPDDLHAQLRYVDAEARSVWLQDGSSIKDEGARLRAFRSTDATIHLMIAQAKSKGWSGLSMRGDEAFLRRATRLAYAEGLTIAGRDDAMEAVVQDELQRLALEREGIRQDPNAEGYGEAIPADSVTGDTAKQGYYKSNKENPFISTQTRIWEQIYGEESLPEDLGPELRYIDRHRQSIYLRDGASLQDHGHRIESFSVTADAFRLVIAQARAKGWSGISIRGDETFLRIATRIATEEDFPIAGRNADMDHIIQDEIHIVRGEHTTEDAAPEIDGP